MDDQMESQEVSATGSLARQNASVARSHRGKMAASKSNSCGVISAKPSSHRLEICSEDGRWKMEDGKAPGLPADFGLWTPDLRLSVAASSNRFPSCNTFSTSQFA